MSTLGKPSFSTRREVMEYLTEEYNSEETDEDLNRIKRAIDNDDAVDPNDLANLTVWFGEDPYLDEIVRVSAFVVTPTCSKPAIPKR